MCSAWWRLFEAAFESSSGHSSSFACSRWSRCAGDKASSLDETPGLPQAQLILFDYSRANPHAKATEQLDAWPQTLCWWGWL